MDAFQWLYSDIVKDHFVNPRNVFDPEKDSDFKPDTEGMVGNIKCGDQMMFMLKINNDIIEDVRWKTYGCASAIASTSMLSETIKGMNIKDAYFLKPSDIAHKLGGLPENKIHCSVLGDKALRAAIDSYLEHQGRIGEFKRDETQIICKCLNISDTDIEEAVKQGARDWHTLQEATKMGKVCGSCKEKGEALLYEFIHIYA